MTKEEQRFTAAVAAMQAIIQKGPIHRLYADMPTLISESVEHTIEEAMLYADALIKELDKDKPSDIDVINAAIKHVEDMGFKPNRFVNIVKIKRLCEDNTHDCPNCNFDDINSIEDCCPKCGSKIEWV